tara:strand:+ start:37 stop:333 length:297 start_codon:yes stop_codon:yes gene_type:complete
MQTTLERPRIKTTVPRLTCFITGKSRPTNHRYLAQKAADRNVTVEQFSQYYTCKQAVKRLRAGMSVEDVRMELGSDAATPIDNTDVVNILKLNGKVSR